MLSDISFRDEAMPDLDMGSLQVQKNQVNDSDDLRAIVLLPPVTNTA
jgi:hypothetical protein